MKTNKQIKKNIQNNDKQTLNEQKNKKLQNPLEAKLPNEKKQ